MNPGIVDLSIERFRIFRELKLDGLGRVNLITGRNNTGKSSLLEALRLLVSDFSPATVYSILNNREEVVSGEEEPDRSGYAEIAAQILTLFHGFPSLAASWEPIVVAASDGQRPIKLTLTLDWFSEERVEDGRGKYVPHRISLFDEQDGIPAEEGSIPMLVFEINYMKRTFPLEDLWNYAYGRRSPRTEYERLASIPCVYVNPYGGEGTARLGALWDKIALSDSQTQVVEALRIIDPSITAVSMVKGDVPRRPRTAIVRSDKIPRPVPLRSFGDGLNRLFGIALSLVNAKDGLLLIDEFENGMHYSVQLDAWRMIFKLAEELGVQVFATSHSWDTVVAFQQAAAETEEQGVLVRLARKGEDIIPTLIREDEMKIVTRHGIEVR